ncbi:MAG: 50S ribosomal protein L4 [Chlamydiae bacterium]|nr:50S ribosomal protein L4 [Chlamydiota bacterium]
MDLKSFSLEAEKVKDVKFKVAKREKEISPQLVKDYIVAYRRNQRQWSANTKGRSEVNHSNKKPHRQKGTGKARQGTLAAPQYRGGGIVFGPKPKFDQHIRINQKEKRAVVNYLIEQKVKDKKLILIDKTDMKAPQTKTLAAFMAKCGLDKKRTLFILDAQIKAKEGESLSSHTNFKKSLNNLSRADFTMVNQLNGYQLLRAEHVVITETGLKQFMESIKS